MSHFEKCPYCGGEGCDEVASPAWDDPFYAVVVKCKECNGSGWVDQYGTPKGQQDYEPPDPSGWEGGFAENH